MIKVDRSDAPAVLVGDDSKGGRERKAWREYYRQGLQWDPEAEKPSFDAYSEKSVKDALIEMFRGKCAYCESEFTTVAWGDVEHYRPKSGIRFDDGTVKKPGYWWLASDWDNLLPSCNRCNSFNRQEIGGKKERIGKSTQFPLEVDNRHRWPDDDPYLWQGNEEGEVPLLLDPCRDKPWLSLKCQTAEGTENRGALVGLDDKGKRSILVFGLNKDLLVKRRRKRLKKLDLAMKEYRELRIDIEELKIDMEEARQEGKQEKLARKEARFQKKGADLVLKKRALEEEMLEEEEDLLMTTTLIRSFLAAEPDPA